MLVQTPSGRQYFVTPEDFNPLVTSGEKTKEYPLSKLIAFTEHPDLIRRGGVMSCIKYVSHNPTLILPYY